MKKKGITILLAIMLMAASTNISYGATYKANNLYGSLNSFFKIYSTYIHKYLQNGGQQNNSQQNSNPQDNSQQDNKPQNNNQQSSNQQQEKPQNPNSGNQGNIQTGKAAEVLNLVNKERNKVGLPSLKLDSQLNNLAQMKAEDMAKKGYLSHNSPTYGSAFDMMKEYGVSYKTAGENIAKGQKSSDSVMRAWMNSSGHRANILNSGYTRLGVGYATDAKGNTYWVQMFVG